VIVAAWCTFQPRTLALARALGGEAHFLQAGALGPLRFLLPLRYLRDAVRMWLRLNQRQASVVYAVSPPVFTPLVALAWCALHRRPLLMDCHTDAFQSRKWAWSRPIHRWISRRAVVVTLHTEAMAEEVRRWGATAILLPDDLPSASEAAACPRPTRPRVVVAGALDAQEPVALVVEAARRLPGVEVRLTGDERRVPAEVRAAAPPNLMFTGWLDYPRFLGELLAADVVAAFSSDPGIMNRAAFEAIGLGKALVLTDFIGLRERFGSAAIYTDNDAGAMAEALLQALRERDTMELRSVAAQNRLRTQWEVALDQLKHLLDASRTHQGRPRRVLMVSQHPYPFASVLRRNVDHLLAEGLQVDVVCTADGPPIASTAHSALKLYRIPVKHRRRPTFWYAVEYLIFFVLAFPLVSWLGFRRRYDIVQVDNVPDLLAFSVLVPRLRGARIVLHMWELMPEMTSARLGVASGHPLVRVAAWLEQRATRWVDHVIAVNDACRRVLIERGVPHDKVSMVFNTQPDLGSGATASPTGQTLITHGTLVKRYGVQVAILALHALQHDWPQLTLKVIGGGEYLPELRALAAELGVETRVRFCPWLSFVDVLAEIRQATLGIVPVVADGYGHVILPTKLFDYVAEGVPTVCSRLPAVEERFPPDSLAYFPPGDAHALAREIDRLLRDPDRGRRQAERAKEVMRTIDWATMSRQYLVALGAT